MDWITIYVDLEVRFFVNHSRDGSEDESEDKKTFVR